MGRTGSAKTLDTGAWGANRAQQSTAAPRTPHTGSLCGILLANRSREQSSLLGLPQRTCTRRQDGAARWRCLRVAPRRTSPSGRRVGLHADGLLVRATRVASVVCATLCTHTTSRNRRASPASAGPMPSTSRDGHTADSCCPAARSPQSPLPSGGLAVHDVLRQGSTGIGGKRVMKKSKKPTRPGRRVPASARPPLEHRGSRSPAAGTRPPGTTDRDAARPEAWPRHHAWLQGTAARPATVEVRCNATPRHSWQAALTLGPTDRIIMDGQTAAHAIERLLTALPAALAARHPSEARPLLSRIKALHPSGFEILLQVPSLEEIDATITDLLRQGYRPAGPSRPGWRPTAPAPGLAAPEEAPATPKMRRQYRRHARASHRVPPTSPPP